MEINKNHSTGSNYYMNFNLKGRESVLFDLQAVAVKRGIARWEAVEIVITDPFGFMMNHITYKRVETPTYLVLPAVPKMQVPELQEWSRGFRKAMSSPIISMKRR